MSNKHGVMNYLNTLFQQTVNELFPLACRNILQYPVLLNITNKYKNKAGDQEKKFSRCLVAMIICTRSD